MQDFGKRGSKSLGPHVKVCVCVCGGGGGPALDPNTPNVKKHTSWAKKGGGGSRHQDPPPPDPLLIIILKITVFL